MPSGTQPANDRPAVLVDTVMDAAGFAGLPLLVMLATAVVMVLDGLDIQLIGFAAPVIADRFGIDRAALAPALAAGLVGMALGGLLLGPLGDRRGRRTVLLASVFVFGVATALTATANTVTALTVWRFFTGIGLGGALPTATALMAEFAPPKFRSQAIAAAIVGVPLGGMIGAAIAAEVIPAFGWRAIFVVGGVMPLAALVVICMVLPESPRFLASRPDRKADLAATLNRVAGCDRFTIHDSYIGDGGATERREIGTRALFAPDVLRDTMTVWFVFITNLFAVFAFFNWAPTALTSLGLSLETSMRGCFYFNLAGTVGAVTISWIIARAGSRWPLAILATVGSAAMLYVAHLARELSTTSAIEPVGGILAGMAVGGFAVLAVQVSMYAVAAHVYPAACRSSGLGWAGAMGRLAGVASAFIGGALLARASGAAFFGGLSAVLCASAFGILLLRRHIPVFAGSSRFRSES